MSYPDFAKSAAHRWAPGLMAQRARRYERNFRERQGIVQAAEALVAETGLVVTSGPFSGMRYPDDRLADIDTPLGKLSGSYEIEIQQPFEQAIADGAPTFIDIGCADGYYAVGMPFASRTVVSYAFDLAKSARDLCEAVAETNAVNDRVHIGKRFSASSLNQIDTTGALLLCDIEGAEADLFTGSLVERLALATVVIEVHEDARPGTGDMLKLLFRESHQVKTVRQRHDNAAENRPALMHWLVARPKPGSTGSVGRFRPACKEE